MVKPLVGRIALSRRTLGGCSTYLRVADGSEFVREHVEPKAHTNSGMVVTKAVRLKARD
tara:strand:+ start:93240 stop:93416 length:177 start_codon:yes stop_codon:yes gene_type:complete